MPPRLNHAHAVMSLPSPKKSFVELSKLPKSPPKVKMAKSITVRMVRIASGPSTAEDAAILADLRANDWYVSKVREVYRSGFILGERFRAVNSNLKFTVSDYSLRDDVELQARDSFVGVDEETEIKCEFSVMYKKKQVWEILGVKTVDAFRHEMLGREDIDGDEAIVYSVSKIGKYLFVGMGI